MNRNTTIVVFLVGVLVIVFLTAPPHPTHSSPPLHGVAVVHKHMVFPNIPHTMHRVQGPPTVTASFIDRVLARASSPAQGIGTVMVQEGMKYGIDPVYALAFFHHESSFGLAGVARSTHSIGNIRCTEGYSCDPTGGYRSYPSYTVALDDWYALITAYIAHGLTTVETIIPTYAPTADNNNEAAYIASVNKDVAMWRQGRL